MPVRRKGRAWEVALIPAGPQEEAEAAARLARRMVAQWILRAGNGQAAGCGDSTRRASDPSGSRPAGTEITP